MRINNKKPFKQKHYSKHLYNYNSSIPHPNTGIHQDSRVSMYAIIFVLRAILKHSAAGCVAG